MFTIGNGGMGHGDDYEELHRGWQRDPHKVYRPRQGWLLEFEV